MPTLVTCTNCGSSLRAPDNAAGKRVKCPKCNGIIPVPAAEEEAVDLGKLGVQAEPPDAAVAPARRHREEEEYDRTSTARRRGDDDDDDEIDEELRRRRSRRSAAAAPGGGLQLGLGIAALSVGILGLLISWIPVFGSVVCGIGLILGVVALIVSISSGRGYGFPIAGSAVSGVALAISLIVTLFIFAAVRNVAEQVQQQAIMQQQAFVQQGAAPVGPPTPPTGAIALVGGKGQLEGQLTLADPIDRVQMQSRCKVFTVNMKAERTYQIDMIRKVDGKAGFMQFDPFLRLEDADGNQLMWDDDGGGNLNARIVFRCPRNGTFRVVATSLGGLSGAFTLTIAER